MKYHLIYKSELGHKYDIESLTGKPAVMGILISKTTICAVKVEVTGTGNCGLQITQPLLSSKIRCERSCLRVICKYYLRFMISRPESVINTESPAAAHVDVSSLTCIALTMPISPPGTTITCSPTCT